MTADEILACAREAVARLRHGGDAVRRRLRRRDRVDRRRRSAHQGARPRSRSPSASASGREDLAAWREAGADRYLLRFETSDAELYERIHPPPGRRSRPLRHPAHAARPGLRSRQRRHGRHPRPELRERRRRHRRSSAAGPRHDRRRTVPLASGDTAGRRELAAQVPPAGAGARRRADDLQSRRADAAACPEANIPSTTALATLNKRTAASWACSAAPTSSCPTSPRPIPRAVRDLSRQGLRQRDRRDVPRLPPRSHRDDRTDPRDGARRAEAASRRLTALGSFQPP